MKHGYIRVAAANFNVEIANVTHNVNEIIKGIEQAKNNDAKLFVTPELSITGYTIGDLVLQNTLLSEAKKGLDSIIEYSIASDMIICVGLPYQHLNNLYNCAAVIQNGQLLGLVAKTHIPNYLEFYEGRYFKSAPKTQTIQYNDQDVLFGNELIFQARNFPSFTLGVEICEDAWVMNSPSTSMVLKGATIIANLSASNELVTKKDYRKSMLSSLSAKGICGYVYSSAGVGESSTDLVYGGHLLTYENGTLLNESTLYESQIQYSDLDLEKLISERRKMTTYQSIDNNPILFDIKPSLYKVKRYYSQTPFIPLDLSNKELRCREIIDIQTQGLVQRLRSTKINHVVIGVSGGLDSTLALLVCVEAFNYLNIPTTNIIALTMPCFGTTSRTKNNATQLMEQLNVSYETIDISNSVQCQFNDLKHDNTIFDITYENVQARTRTQMLMNKANQVNGLVIGTGDLSEIALGWSTYNGDHMSMYSVNCSIPKTLVSHLVAYLSDKTTNKTLSKTLKDIVNTPISPELIPSNEDQITQETESIVGPYVLHDFFLYHMIRFGDSPSKLLNKAIIAFEKSYDKQFILKYMELYYKRFFTQQFKRSCIPDGPKVGSVSLSPRGDWRMPSDASYKIWLEQLEQLKTN